MSSDSDERLPPVKRRRYGRISVPPSSDESDSAVLRTQKRRVVPKRTSGLEFAGTSASVDRGNGNADRSSKRAIPPADPDHRIEPKQRSKSSKSVKITEKTKEDTATSSKDIAKSDASDVHGEQCPICLIVFVNQEVASPSSCEHFFCFSCLMEWSKNTNTCPVDRKTFNVIDVRPKFGGKVERHIPVTVNTNGDEDETDRGDVDDSDDDLELRIASSAFLAGFAHIVFPGTTLFSSNFPSLTFSSEVLNSSSESSSEAWGNDRASSSSSSSSTDCDEPSSPPVIVISSENETSSECSSPSEDLREASSPQSDIRQFSSPDYNRQSSSASDNLEVSAPSDNQEPSSPSGNQEPSSPSDNQRFSSPSVEQYY